ncbi:GumC family protein [Oceaniglobus roseus]|uniref:GumC family protein n=1 Tax=Oceaniglobus roseus TaxID=1737570 RepID=UPI000D6D3834|nr:DUF874 domain-containing protein [Kandeliimicrobium roseum]
MGPIYTLDDVIDMVRRHLRLILGLVLLGCAVSVLYAQHTPHLYRSSETIQIERPKIANDLAASTVEGSSARRLQLIQQQIMSRGSLIGLIENYGLYRDLPALTLSEKVDLLRRSIRIDGVAAAREGFADDGTISMLTVTAEMPSPELAQQIATEISNRTIAQSTSERLDQSQATLDFFRRREEGLKADLAALEDRIAAFRNDNKLAIEGSVEFNRTEVATLNQQLLDLARERIRVQRELDQVGAVQTRRATAEQKRAELNAELAALDAQRELLNARLEELTKTLDTSPEVERQLADFERDRETLQDQLNVAVARRSDAEIGLRLESRNNAEKLTVIEAAVMADYPFTRSRKVTVLMGALASLVAALGVAFLLELRNPVIRTAGQMRRETGLDPVVSIPVLKTKVWRPSLRARIAGLLPGGRRRLAPPQD